MGQKNRNEFHKSIRFCIYQCNVCKEAWPVSQKLTDACSYICKQCKQDKDIIKKFSKQNCMIPVAVPSARENLTQVEEMLIARALPVIHVYLKPGGILATL